MPIRSVFGNREGREKKILPNRDYYKTLVDNKKEATFLSDADGDLYLINKKAQLLSGYNEEQIGDYHLRDLFFTRKNTDNPFDSQQPSEFTARLMLLDSRRYLIPVMCDFQEIEGQKFLCTCVEAPDAEQPSRSPDLTTPPPIDQTGINPSQASTDFPSRWSGEFEHQIRTLLNQMLGFGSLLERDPAIAGNKAITGKLDAILTSGNRLKRLVNQLSFGDSDFHEVNRGPCLLASILQKIALLADPAARHNRIKIVIDQPDSVTVFSDEFLLLDILRFLVGKAVTYTRKEEVTIRVTENKPEGKALITIDNLGHDIPQGVINFIRRENSRDSYDLTNPAIQQHPELSSVLHSLNRIGGKLSFLLTANQEEIAELTVPLAVGQDREDDIRMLEEAVREKKLHVLIVEDERFTAQILQMYLNDLASVSVAYSGNEALNIAEQFYNQGIVFQAVLMDIDLPKPWDGILLKKEMESKWPEYQHIPFLAQTAISSKSSAERIRDHAFTGHLIKPINRLDILTFIHRFCR